ncbi:succinate--CoA ligase subunit alpha [Carboxydothermus ferrireducens]|uniref:Succinate--CoA ligase [ADP-forming] subunit alpha n=1 Tax=Carboxydothermus ferrireducens DSM 11255 TaxID=1119529 RepID=A0ABX2R9Q1_9THEO|nr:succinate--CoA ligase subunit alpha [Carboxydothermus ferrireducens]NYE56818.1 succinyl-CoA synthetase alpha subunit [Carboxydothermus ferrireducens DSM 11255]
MAIIITEETRIVVQGITGNQGRFHTGKMLEYGSKVVAGVSPGKGGTEVLGVPVFNTVLDAVKNTGANTSILFIPAPFVLDAALEAMEAGIKTIVIISEHVPLHDALKIMRVAEVYGVTVVGPNTFGVISPGIAKVGIMPNTIYQKGPVGIVARSGTLSYQIAYELTRAGLGQSTVVGLGGDRVVGLSLAEVILSLARDEETQGIVVVGEIGGTAEEEAAEVIRHINKPVVAFIAGKTAPPGKRMGHAGAIIERGRGTYQSKIDALWNAGALIAEVPWEVPVLMKSALVK